MCFSDLIRCPCIGLNFGLGNSPVNARAYRVTLVNDFLAAQWPPLVQYETVLFFWYSTFKRNATVHGSHGSVQLNESARHWGHPLAISATSEEHQEKWQLIGSWDQT